MEASEHSYAAGHNILEREGWLKLVKRGGLELLTNNRGGAKPYISQRGYPGWVLP